MRSRAGVFSQKVKYLRVCRTRYNFSMTDKPDRVATYSGSFSSLTLGKAGQMAKGFGACNDPPVFLNLALELDLVIHRTLL